MNYEFPPINWIVEKFIPEGLTVIVGAPKLGKSWLALSICSSVAVGGTVLGQIKVEKGKVLYLALEDTGRRLKDRLFKIHAVPSQNLNIGFRVAQGNKGTAELRQWLEKHTDTRLIVIDTWTRFNGLRDNNDYQATTAAASEIKKLADEFGIGIVLIHHAKKGNDENSDFIEKSLGSTGLVGAADTIAVLQRKRGNKDVTLSITGRDVSESEYALEFDHDELSWKLLGTRQEVQASDSRRQIYEVIKDAEEPLAPKEITNRVNEASGIKRSGSTIRSLLQKMVSDGVLTTMSGVYVVASETSVDSVDIDRNPVYASTLSTEGIPLM